MDTFITADQIFLGAVNDQEEIDDEEYIEYIATLKYEKPRDQQQNAAMTKKCGPEPDMSIQVADLSPFSLTMKSIIDENNQLIKALYELCPGSIENMIDYLIVQPMKIWKGMIPNETPVLNHGLDKYLGEYTIFRFGVNTLIPQTNSMQAGTNTTPGEAENNHEEDEPAATTYVKNTAPSIRHFTVCIALLYDKIRCRKQIEKNLHRDITKVRWLSLKKEKTSLHDPRYPREYSWQIFPFELLCMACNRQTLFPGPFSIPKFNPCVEDMYFMLNKSKELYSQFKIIKDMKRFI